jgi:hypothetical protein
VRTVTTAIGKVPVDGECLTLQGKAHVYCEDKDVFDCMLNQVNRTPFNSLADDTCLL